MIDKNVAAQIMGTLKMMEEFYLADKMRDEDRDSYLRNDAAHEAIRKAREEIEPLLK